jgi:predicted alpha-1,2-mannosidase
MMRRLGWLMIFALLFVCLPLVVACGDDDDDDDDATPADDDDATPDDDDDATPGDDDDDDDDDDNDDDTTPPDVLDYVDPFIGTGGLGFGYASAYPGPKAPNGLMSLSPDTTNNGLNYGFNHFSGYYYPDPQIRGFTHTHFHGTGAPDYSNVLVMPMSAKPGRRIAEKDFRSKFNKINEHAEAGYYAVYLEDPQVKVELATRDYAAIHRYEWMGEGDPYIVVYPSYSIEAGWVLDATVEIDEATRTVTGMLDFNGPLTGRGGSLLIYYALQFSEPITQYGTFTDGVTDDGDASAQGADVGCYLGFGAKDRAEVKVRAAISYQSVDQALANLADQMPDFDFEAAVQDTQNAWRDVLGKIDIEGGTVEDRTIFYTAMYHTYMMPTNWTEAGGTYFGFDKGVHDAAGTQYFTDFSMWDTFHTVHPLLNLIDPEISAGMMQSLVRMIEQGGAVPEWPAADGYTGTMIGSPGHIVLAEAYLKGITGWDVDTAYAAVFEQATDPAAPRPRNGLAEYQANGYMSVENHQRGVSEALEFYYADAAIALWAEGLGHTADAAVVYAQSQNYPEHFNSDTLFMEPRHADGSFMEDWLPGFVFSDYYVEGNAWHWTFYVPYDALGFISLFPDEQTFVDKLNFAFEMGEGGPDTAWLPDIYYWFGNEMNMFHNWMFNYTSRKDLAQKWTRWILDAKFRAEPGGLDGNDDCGTLSSWYVFGSLGFFPLAGTDIYTIGSPIWDGATLHLPGGDLVLTVENPGSDNPYVQSVHLNGNPLDEPFFTHDQIASGGTLAFVLGPDPSDWFNK